MRLHRLAPVSWKQARLLGACLLALVVACASAYMRGGTPVDGPPPNPSATYLVSQCTEIATQAPIPLPQPLRYALAEGSGGPVLYETDGSGKTTMVTNHWVQEDGADVFFMWVARSHGYQWVLPKQRSEGGVRFVFPAGTFESFADGPVSKVAGQA
ncbi:MAG: hypothetical protein ACQGVK_14935 [Myxococcota bacterium]